MRPFFLSILMLAGMPALADPMGLERVNALRDVQGLKPLVYDGRLAQAAQTHASDMAEHDYFSHKGRDGGLSMVLCGREYRQGAAVIG